jgi:putative oxidoreductase
MKKRMIVCLFQIISAAILFPAAWSKLSSSELSIYIFTELGMEPAGRILIGLIECIAALFLLNPRLAASGALLATGTMLGAIIAHATFLGFDLQGDGGKHIAMLAAVLISSIVVLYLRRKQLPFVGSSL